MAAGAEPRGRAFRRGLPTLALVALLVLAGAGRSAADIVSTTGTLVLGVSSGNVCHLTAAGLGLGTTTPSANLHVAGNAIMSSSLGIGTTASVSTLEVSGTLGYSVQSVSANTILSGNSLVLVDSSSANITISLPSANTITGRVYTVKKTANTNEVEVGSGIDGKDRYLLTSGGNTLPYLQVISSGSKWLSIGQSSGGLSAAAVASGNLRGYWMLDETSGNTALDSSGYGHHATLLGGATFSGNSVTGRVGGALSLNGTSDYLDPGIGTGLAAFLSNGPFTVSVWCKTDSSTTRQAILADWHAGGAGESFSMEIQAASNYRGWIRPSMATVTGGTVVAGTWTHVAITYEPGAFRLFINGTLITTNTTPVSFTSGSYLCFGRGGAYAGLYFDGVIDDLRIYNKALNTSEITILYQVGQ